MVIASVLKGRCQLSPQKNNNMKANIGNIYVELLQEVTKRHLHHLFGVSGMVTDRTASCTYKAVLFTVS